MIDNVRNISYIYAAKENLHPLTIQNCCVMLNVITIEDENPATKMMYQMLVEMPGVISVKAKLHSVKESITYLSGKPGADIIFSDVRLSDGLAFDIFEETGVGFPVIFTTCYDKYMLKAFEANGIDYLLKPFDIGDIEKSIEKYNSLQSHFTNNRLNMPIQNLEDFLAKRKKTRLMVKNGLENIPLLLENIALFYTLENDKVVYVLDRFSNKYNSDKTLAELEEELDRYIFFRANRQYLINVGFVKSYVNFQKVKLRVEVNIAGTGHSIIISQETAPAFRRWIQDT